MQLRIHALGTLFWQTSPDMSGDNEYVTYDVCSGALCYTCGEFG